MKPISIIIASLLFAAAASAAPTPSIPQPSFAWGKASWYGYEWTKGKRGTMANGRKFDPHAWTAASYEYPLGSILEVTNQQNGHKIAVMVTDRGPARRLGRLLDLSEAAATALDYRHEGITVVAVRVLVLPQQERYFRTIASRSDNR